MQITTTKIFFGTPFEIECAQIENTPGTWSSSKISIFRDEILIGEYIRNYSRYDKETFYPFLVGDDWYALYSADYTATRVMRLYDDRIEDWCGEDGRSDGFCPVDFRVPCYNKFSVDGMEHYDIDPEHERLSEYNLYKDQKNLIETKYCDFGFIQGAVWGDDNTWKLKYIDLSNIANKEISIIEKFGYCQIPDGMRLRQCVNMELWEPDHNWISIYRAEQINLTTGERC